MKASFKSSRPAGSKRCDARRRGSIWTVIVEVKSCEKWLRQCGCIQSHSEEYPLEFAHIQRASISLALNVERSQ